MGSPIKTMNPPGGDKNQLIQNLVILVAVRANWTFANPRDTLKVGHLGGGINPRSRAYLLARGPALGALS